MEVIKKFNEQDGTATIAYVFTAVDLMGDISPEVAIRRQLLRTAYGWVIEHESSPVTNPDYFCIENKQYEWSSDHLKAMRFGRKEDAIAMASMLEGDHRICEHGWD